MITGLFQTDALLRVLFEQSEEEISEGRAHITDFSVNSFIKHVSLEGKAVVLRGHAFAPLVFSEGTLAKV